MAFQSIVETSSTAFFCAFLTFYTISFLIINNGTSSSSVLLSVTAAGSLDSSAAAWAFILARYTTSNSISEGYGRHRANFPKAYMLLKSIQVPSERF